MIKYLNFVCIFNQNRNVRVEITNFSKQYVFSEIRLETRIKLYLSASLKTKEDSIRYSNVLNEYTSITASNSFALYDALFNYLFILGLICTLCFGRISEKEYQFRDLRKTLKQQK